MPTPVITLAPGVHRIPTLGDFINTFALLNADGSVTLIDCGLKTAPARIVAGLAAIGQHPKDVQRIVLTHAHEDHTGGAADMLSRTEVAGASIHTDDAPFVTSGILPPRQRSTASGKLLAFLPNRSVNPFAVLETLTDGQLLDVSGGLRIVHTPGHTPGHISLLHEESGVLITGDSLFNVTSRITWSFSAFCTNYEQSKSTAIRLGDLDFSIAAFTHGPEIRDRARERIMSFLTKKGARP